MKAANVSRILALVLAAIAAGCGGGADQVAGVSTGGSGVASGTVSGFGSIILDGDRYDETGAIFEIEDDPRAAAPRVVGGGARLGERVEATVRANGSVERVRIEPALIGPSRDPDLLQMTLRVAGQVVKVNLNPNAGPVTLLDLPTFEAIMTGGNLQVHGMPVFDGASGSYRLHASRIESVSSAPNLVRTSGVVSALTDSDFQLGDLKVQLPAGGALVVPANRTLANGQHVTVWGTALTGTPPAQTLDAVAVRIRALPPTTAGGPPTFVAGTVGKLDSANLSFDLAGVTVDARNASVVPAGQGLVLADGQYVIARGTVNASGTLVAQQVRIRRKLNNEPEIELRGTITNYVSDSNFRVRGTLVDASGVTSRPSCPVQLGNDLVVQIVGGVLSGSQDVVTAERLSCPGN